MTATSHHALQLAHTAGMLSALVHNERAATESRTWGRGENYLERYHVSLPVAKENSSFLWKTQGLRLLHIPTPSALFHLQTNKREIKTTTHLLYKCIHSIYLTL